MGYRTIYATEELTPALVVMTGKALRDYWGDEANGNAASITLEETPPYEENTITFFLTKEQVEELKLGLADDNK